MTGRRWVVIPVLLVAAAGALAAETRDYLFKYVGFSASDLRALNQGAAVAKVLDSDNPIEVAAFGAIKVNVPGETLLRKYKDIANFKKSREILQIGKFAQPPRIEDLAGMTLDSSEVSSLRDCTVGACSMKMTSDMIRVLKTQVDWSSSTSNQQALESLRRSLFDYLTRYLEQGNKALAVYVDKQPSVALAEQFGSLLKASPYLGEIAEFQRYLLEFPNAKLAGFEDFVYWSREQFGVKPVLSMTHVTIQQVQGNGPSPIIVGAKQIFANHYFTTSLGLAVYSPLPGGNSGYLMYCNRTRVDLLGGFLGFLRRWVLNRKIRQGLEENLILTKHRLESQ